MNMQNGSRQEQILNLLLHSGVGMSIDEMAFSLSISRNAVKQHLVMLEKQQLVREAALTNTGGRPARCYALTDKGRNSFPKQYAWFCNLLLSNLAADMSEEALEKMMWDMGVKLASSMAPQFANKSPQQKLDALLALMQNLGYHANIDENENLPCVKAVNCVYHDLAQQYPAICQFDQALISTLLDKPLEQVSCMAKNDCDCRFKIDQ
ncbi:MAG: helix-turn-helix transcriptional regulator [Gammaproteobacteria bacterium]